jgi:hypothetical protein
MSVSAHRPGGLWRQPDFGLFWTGESISEAGNSVTVVVTPLVATETLHASIVARGHQPTWLLPCHDEAMRVQRFDARVAAGPRGRGVIAVPFDPDEVWGAKAEHPAGGTINGRHVRGTIAPDGSGWAFTLSPMWMRGAEVAAGDDVMVELGPEGPQRGDLADDIAAALEASPAAAAFFDTLAQFYRKAYLRWIDATTRRPDLRAARIAEVVDLLAAGVKERPRPPRQSIPWAGRAEN